MEVKVSDTSHNTKVLLGETCISMNCLVGRVNHSYVVSLAVSMRSSATYVVRRPVVLPTASLAATRTF